MSNPITVRHLGQRFEEEWEAFVQFIEDEDYEKAQATITILETLGTGLVGRMNGHIKLAYLLAKKLDNVVSLYGCFECEDAVTRESVFKLFPVGTKLRCDKCRKLITVGVDVDGFDVRDLEGA
jgi:hypothetical protein